MKKQQNEFLIISNRNQKMNQKRLVLDRKYAKMLGLRKEKLENKKARELERAEKRLKKLMEIELHNLTNKRQKKIPEDKTIKICKKNALAEIQRYAKLSRAVWSTEWPMIFLVDKMKRVPLDKNVHGWHCYPQSNYAGLAFCVDNIRPISWMWNKKQLDMVGLWVNNLPKDIQEELEIRSQDKTEKRSMRDRKFYQEIIEKYQELNRIEEIRLWIKKKSST